MSGKGNNTSERCTPNEKNMKVKKKTHAVWTLVVLICLLVMALANMILTIIILSVLRLGNGMECLELFQSSGIVKFFGLIDLGSIFKPDGEIDFFRDIPGEIKGVKGPAIFEVEDSKGRARNSLLLEQNGTHFKGINSFVVGDVFTAENPNYNLPSGVRNLQANIATVKRVSGPADEKFVLRSDHFTKLRGSEGTKIEGKEILWSADQEVRLKSINGSVILSGKEGIVLDIKNIPIVPKTGLGGQMTPQYKVCICMPQGKLFRVPVSMDHNSRAACHNIDVSSSFNPCM